MSSAQPLTSCRRWLEVRSDVDNDKSRRQWLPPTPPGTAPCRRGWPVVPGLYTFPRKPAALLLRNSCWWSSWGGTAGCWGPCRELCLWSGALGAGSASLLLRGLGLHGREGGSLGWGAAGPVVASHVSFLRVERKQAWCRLSCASCWSYRGWRGVDRKRGSQKTANNSEGKKQDKSLQPCWQLCEAVLQAKC